MTFKNLKDIDTTESRKCALVFNFNNKDLIGGMTAGINR